MRFLDDFTTAYDKFFSFVKRDSTRVALSSDLAYVYRLMRDSASCDNKRLQLLIRRDVAVHFGSIIEALILYMLQEYESNGIEIIKRSKTTSYEVCDIVKCLPEFKENKSLAIVKESNEDMALNNKIQFIQLNRIALRSKLLTRGLFEDAEFIREERNKIHSKDSYTVKDVQEVFNAARRIKRHVAKKLSEL